MKKREKEREDEEEGREWETGESRRPPRAPRVAEASTQASRRTSRMASRTPPPGLLPQALFLVLQNSLTLFVLNDHPRRLNFGSRGHQECSKQ